MMQGRFSRSRKIALTIAIAACMTFGVARFASSRIAGGHGKKGDCYAEFDGITSTKSGGAPLVDCMDGDPACDQDGDCHNGSCTFMVSECVNQTDIADCSPPSGGLKKLTVNPPKVRGLVSGLSLTGASCGNPFGITVKTTKKNKKPGKLKVTVTAKAVKGSKPANDIDVVTLLCRPRPAGETCPVRVTTTTTTTTTMPPCLHSGACTCAGTCDPLELDFTTGIGSGDCGHLDSDTTPNFFPLKCGGLYFGGAGVGVPLPSKIPDMGTSATNVSCSGTTLTLTARTSAQTGGNRCSGGSNHHQPCNDDSGCPGGKCKLLTCTAKDCLFGPPLPIPNSSHNGAATSTCVINTISQDATGSADCSTGSTTNLNLPLASGLHLTGDLLPKRCTGGPTAGKGCLADGDCGSGGTCANDTGRCADLLNVGGTNAGTVCTSDSDCTNGGTCERGACVGGSKSGQGCIVDADCPSSTCKTFIQPCPICNSDTLVCDGGPNDGLACTPGDSAVDGDYPTSHDCPPPTSANLGSLPIGFVLDTGTKTKSATDLTDQPNVFCGFCKNKVSNQFKDLGTSTAHQAVPCATNADCAAFTTGSFTSCGQRTAGAFTANDVARTIVETGTPAGPLTTGGPEKPSTLVSIFCIPPTFSSLVDSAADLGGPGAVALQGKALLK